MNKSGIHPKGWAVLVSPIEVEQKTESGIVIADATRDKEQAAQNQGVLLEVGSFAWNDEPEPRAQLGDLVVFGKYKGEVLKGVDGSWYRILNDKDVIAVIDEPLDKGIRARNREPLDTKGN